MLNVRAYRNQNLLEVCDQVTSQGDELFRCLKLQISNIASDFLLFNCEQPPHPFTAEKKLIAQWIVKQYPPAGPIVRFQYPFEPVLPAPEFQRLFMFLTTGR